jgi:hypothetical protein
MARTAFPLTNFQTPDGNAVANGTVIVRLSQDGTGESHQVEHKFTAIPLDSSGNVTASPTVIPNSELAPTGTYYVYSVFSEKGQLIAGPNMISA